MCDPKAASVLNSLSHTLHEKNFTPSWLYRYVMFMRLTCVFNNNGDGERKGSEREIKIEREKKRKSERERRTDRVTKRI